MTARPLCNLAVLHGIVTDVTVRLLASGDRLATFALRVPGSGERATSAPVVSFTPPLWLEGLEDERAVVVIGYIQRRFFKLASGATGSQTEIVATSVLRTTEHRRVATALRRATAILEDLAV